MPQNYRNNLTTIECFLDLQNKSYSSLEEKTEQNILSDTPGTLFIDNIRPTIEKILDISPSNPAIESVAQTQFVSYLCKKGEHSVASNRIDRLFLAYDSLSSSSPSPLSDSNGNDDVALKNLRILNVLSGVTTLYVTSLTHSMINSSPLSRGVSPSLSQEESAEKMKRVNELTTKMVTLLYNVDPKLTKQMKTSVNSVVGEYFSPSLSLFFPFLSISLSLCVEEILLFVHNFFFSLSQGHTCTCSILSWLLTSSLLSLVLFLNLVVIWMFCVD